MKGSVIPEEAGPCQWGVLRGFGREKGMRDWRLLFPGSCDIRGEWLVRSGTGRSPGRRGGAGGVLEVTSREPDDLGVRETGAGGLRVVRLCQVRPMVGCVSVRAVPLAAVIPSRVPGRGRGAWGGSRQRSGQAGSIKGAPAPRERAGQTERRPRAWPLARTAVMPPVPGTRRELAAGSGSARRAGRRTPG